MSKQPSKICFKNIISKQRCAWATNESKKIKLKQKHSGKLT